MSVTPHSNRGLEIENLVRAARRAIAGRDWRTVEDCAAAILKRDDAAAEGYFLLGMAAKASKRPKQAVDAFERALSLAPERYDAAIELASQYSLARRNGDAAKLLAKYAPALDNSPLYLDMAGTVYTEIGMPEMAWPLYRKACDLQPEISLFQANRAACAVYVGELEAAREIFTALLAANPAHQRNHYQLSRLARARDTDHIEQMEAILHETQLPPERNIFLYYALGKEYEDLECWEESFGYYKRGGDAATAIAGYDVADDIAIVDTIIEVCNADWLSRATAPATAGKKPLFVVGLPRTGTTLTERILASHSKVNTLGETEFLQMVLRRGSAVESVEKMNPDIIRAAAELPPSEVAAAYLEAVRYRLHEAPLFIDKLPFNVLYLGFIAKAWPDQPIVLLRRNPMDACFSMYKQVFTWAYKYSYDLDNLGRYYIAYERLCRHWQTLLGDRLVEIRYEDLVSDQEAQTRRLLDRLGLPFERACLEFEKNAAPSATASSVQVRQKMHTGSIGRWRQFEQQLAPLAERLVAAGIDIG
jgi:tetratricopeptide (TPR) repeat protein